MDKRAVFLDIDGTLMVDGQVSAAVSAAIAAAQRRGHLFFLNTGRSYAYLPPAVMRAAAWDGVVAGIGADVRVGKRAVWQQAATGESLRRILTFFAGTGRPVMLEGETQMFCFGRHMEGITDLPSLAALDAMPLPRISKLTFPGHPTRQEQAALLPEFVLIQHPTYAEARLADCTKATGMLRALEGVGLSAAASIAMGDSRNDWDMLDAAAISVAMGNADEETKARCTVVAPAAAEDGVAWAIEKYCR